MSKHTPGPWVGEDVELAIVRLIITPETVHAIQVSSVSNPDHVIAYIPIDVREPEQRANGNLILGTPDLLEAAKAALRIPVLRGQRSQALARLNDREHRTVESIRLSREEAQSATREIDGLWRRLRAAIAKVEEGS